MIANLKSFDCERNSPCQYPGKCIEDEKENKDSYARV